MEHVSQLVVDELRERLLCSLLRRDVELVVCKDNLLVVGNLDVDLDCILLCCFLEVVRQAIIVVLNCKTVVVLDCHGVLVASYYILKCLVSAFLSKDKH